MKTGIYSTEEQDGEDNGKISNQGPDLNVEGMKGKGRLSEGAESISVIQQCMTIRKESFP